MSKFISADQYVSVPLIEAELVKYSIKEAIFHVFPGLHNRKWVEISGNVKIQLSSSKAVHRVPYFSVPLIEPDVVKFADKKGYFSRFSGFTEPEVFLETGNDQNLTQLIKSRPLRYSMSLYP